jgi:hypothetical protein
MRRSPSIASSLPDDVEVYLVLDDFGARLGRAWRDTDEERADRQAIIGDLLEGQYSNPVRIVAFNTAENLSRDVSEDIALELDRRLAVENRDVAPEIEEFLQRHASAQPEQQRLRLKGAA